MKKLLYVILFAISANLISTLFVVGSPANVVFYHRRSVPSEWKIWKEADEDQLVTFSLMLKQKNLGTLENLFWENSNPKSSQFAKNIPREEILKLVSPTKEVNHRIIEWLENTSDESVIKNFQDIIQVTTSVKTINRLFNTQMFSFINTRTNTIAFKHLGALNMPGDIASHIELITGITEFLPSTQSKERSSESLEPTSTPNNQCNIPATIKKLYDVPEGKMVTNPLANISIYNEYSVDPNNPSGFNVPSLERFQQANDLPDNPVNCILGNAAKYYSPDGTDEEAALDVQMIQGIAEGVNLCFYVMTTSAGWMLEFATDIFHTPEAPMIVSISYGLPEDTQCDSDVLGNVGNCTELHIPNSAAYVARYSKDLFVLNTRANVEFMKLGLAGFTIIVASGDDGTSGGDCSGMTPLFPASSPYVTTVGATTVEPSTSTDTLEFSDLPPVCTDAKYMCNCSTSTNEQPCLQNNSAQFATGGGFSNYNNMPEYQMKVVESYLRSGVTLPSAYFNTSGRAYPDVSAVGANFCIIDEALDSTACDMVSGTSASAPLWAGLVAILNQDRLDAGKTPLGFLNQILYQMFEESNTKYFNNQFGDGNNSGDCPESNGFNSVSGHWTPLTGLGTPRFAEIRKYVSNLP